MKLTDMRESLISKLKECHNCLLSDDGSGVFLEDLRKIAKEITIELRNIDYLISRAPIGEETCCTEGAHNIYRRISSDLRDRIGARRLLYYYVNHHANSVK